ncbi:MAG: hypothetical protein WCV90_03550 [Candidatus Woesearchaeota archaeon]|jgi:NOL1/NOP2/fmu family ribosome biogenesis protein
MQTLTILNSKEVRALKEQLTRQFGYFPPEDYAYLRNEKEKIFLINKDVAKVDWDKLIVDKMGLYFGEDLGHEFRLSKEGAQLLWMEAKKNKVELKNTLELSKEEVKTYFSGVDLFKEEGEKDNKLVILYYQKEVLGCARYREGKVFNFLPKIHRGEVIL